MCEVFEQLMSAETEEDDLEAGKFFLDKAKEGMEADFKANAFGITAEFDEFCRLARDEFSRSFYARFFVSLSEIIKCHHEE